MDSTQTKACQSFRANLWRPHTCTNCYRSKSLHRPLNSSDSLVISNPTSSKGLLSNFKKISLSSPTKDTKSGKKQLRQVASVSALESHKHSNRTEWSGPCNQSVKIDSVQNNNTNMPQRSLHTGPMVGVVKPYAVVEIDKDSTQNDTSNTGKESEESNLDHATKRRYSESNIQINRVSTINTTSITTALTNGHSMALQTLPSKSTPGHNSDRKLEQKSASAQNLDKVGEANFLDGIPKPARIIGKLLTEFQRSQSSSSLELKGSMQKQGSGYDSLSSKRYARGRSVEPLENIKTNNVSVTRSSSMRQETTSRSKFRAINILSRRKVSDSKLASSANQHSSVKGVQRTPPSSAHNISLVPKVTSPHPVRRNMASSHHQSKKYHCVVKVQPRPRATTMSTNDSCTHLPEGSVQLLQGGLKKQKRNPPEKPPRTLSTFFSSDEQDYLFRQLVESGAVQDVVTGGMKDVALTDSKTIELQSNYSIQPPTHLHTTPTNYTQVQPQTATSSVSDTDNSVACEQTQRLLPLGHTGDYAEVFSRSVSIPSASESLTLSTESSNYDLLKDPGQLSVSPEVPTSIALSSPPASHPNFALPFTSAQPQLPHSPQPSHPHTSDSSNPYYSLPCVSPKEVRTTGSDTPVSTPVQSPMVTQLNNQLLHIMTSTLEMLCQQELDKMTCKESLWKTSWEDLEVKSETEARYKGITISIKASNTPNYDVQQNIKISQLLSPHLNLCLVRSLIDPHPSPSMPFTSSPNYLLTDYTNGKANSFLHSQRSSLSPDSYMELVLLSLTQLFSALKYLYANGVCHRDVGMECLYATKTEGGHWLVRLGDFSYALHRPGPVNATTFVYGYHELNWLGGTDCRLPPEIIDTPQNAQTVDYSHTDSFSAGCLMYDLCGKGNPFELDPELIFYQYADQDLPEFNCVQKNTQHLHKLANLLLKRDPSKRVSASTALLVCQALQWLPEEWLQEPISESQVRCLLGAEKALLVAEMAKREKKGMPLDVLLKAEFLLNCDVSELIRALSLFTHTH